MKVKLNIKSKTMLYQKFNWPIIVAFTLTLVISFMWIKGLYSTSKDYAAQLAELEARAGTATSQTQKVKMEKTIIENKLFIDIATLNSLKQKIQYLGKFTGNKPSLFNFFNGLEEATTGEIFITKIAGDVKTGIFNIEGNSSTADNITEFVKKLQALPYYNSVELKQIMGDNLKQRNNLRFIVSFGFENYKSIEFISPEVITKLSKKVD